MGQVLYGEEFQDKFGQAVAAISADGRKIAVGAVEEWQEKAGFIRVYNYNEANNQWEKMGTTDIVGLAPADRFGYALDLSSDGRVVAVGGHAHNNGDGYVRVFHYSSTHFDWKQLGKTIYGETSLQSIGAFGITVALSGDGMTGAAGAPARWAEENRTDFGKTFVLEYNSENDEWIRKGQVLVGDHLNDNFGWTVDISSDAKVLAVGANKHNGNGPVSLRASVYEFNNDSGEWTPIRGNFAGDGSNKTNFELAYGMSLSPDGNYVAVQDDGAKLCDSNECVLTSRVRVFEKV